MRDDHGDVARRVYGGIWATVSGAFRVPREPPTLPARDADPVEAFRPVPGFLRYLKLKFWIVILPIDVVLVAGWVGAAVFSPWLGALLTIPILGLVVIPDVLAYTAIHLRYDTTWYVLSDRSLRIRRGIMTIVETTITFENVQNVKIQQGPLQRWFGIARLVVETAGGGRQPEEEGIEAHVGLIEGVADAGRIRDLILQRVGTRADTDPWPKAHLAALRDIHGTLHDVRPEAAEASPLPPDEEGLPAGRVVRAIGALIRLPSAPPTLPQWAGERYRFRPARSYLWYRLVVAFLGGFLVAAIPWAIGGLLVVKHPDLIDEVNFGVLVRGWLIVLVAILAFSVFTAWLQYRVTWYVLGERVLRIRGGVWVTREATVSFDNVQNVNLNQGPLARLFGLSAVEVYTAGGGGSTAASGGGAKQVVMVVLTIVSSIFPALQAVSGYGGAGKGKQAGAPTAAGQLSGIVAAAAVRDRIVARVRRSRAAGLGDEADGQRCLRWTPEQLGVLREIRQLVIGGCAAP